MNKVKRVNIMEMERNDEIRSVLRIENQDRPLFYQYLNYLEIGRKSKAFHSIFRGEMASWIIRRFRRFELPIMQIQTV